VSAARRSSSTRRPPPEITVRRLAPSCGLTSPRIIRAVNQARGERPLAALSIAVVDDGRMARLHQEYMADDRPTDVLTFDLRDDPESPAIEGEIVVSADTAAREAERRGLDAKEELTRYIVHGVLHLLGMDDRTPSDRRRMRREEDRVLAALACSPRSNRVSRKKR